MDSETISNDLSVEVVIPVYNGARYIAEALNSVLAQTLLPDRIIVVNDGSTDETEGIVRDIAVGAPVPVKCLNKKNGGLASARNAGICESRADWIAFLDADDVWQPEKLERQVAVIRKSNVDRLGLVNCNFSLIDEIGHPIAERRFRPLRPRRGNIYCQLIKGNIVYGSGSAVVVKRQCFIQVGQFDENLGHSEDWDMWLRLSREYGFDYADGELVAIRRHDSSMQAVRTIRMFAHKMAFYSKWTADLVERGQRCPVQWGLRIAGSIRLTLPDTGRLRVFSESIEASLRRRLFWWALGRPNAAVSLSLVAAPFVDSLRHFIHHPDKPSVSIGIFRRGLIQAVSGLRALSKVTVPGGKVSVVMAAHNTEKHIGQAIRSVLNQTYQNFELFVVDDSSSDGTANIVRDIAGCDRRVILLRNEKEKGVVGARNTALEHASGEYVAILDADDICRPQRFALQVGYLERHPETAVVGGAYAPFREDGSSWVASHPTSSLALAWGSVCCMQFCHPSVMFRREVLQTVHGYRGQHAEDFIFMSDILEGFRAANLKEVLIDYRMWPGNITHTIGHKVSDGAREHAERRFRNRFGFGDDSGKYVSYRRDRVLHLRDWPHITVINAAVLKKIRADYGISRLSIENLRAWLHVARHDWKCFERRPRAFLRRLIKGA